MYNKDMNNDTWQKQQNNRSNVTAGMTPGGRGVSGATYRVAPRTSTASAVRGASGATAGARPGGVPANVPTGMPANMTANAPTDMSANIPEPEKKKRPVWLYAICMILGVAVIGGGVFAVLKIVNPGNTKNDSETAEVVDDDTAGSAAVGNNTELAAGTVTATIDGRPVTYSGAYVVDGIEAVISSGTYESVTDDEAVFLVVNGGALRIEGDVTVNKTGSANFQGRGDEYSFYGTNSAIVVVGEGSSVLINGARITTNTSGANAVVATNGGMAEVTNVTIDTTNDNSRGLHATYMGRINADNVTITTNGGSSASLATDRGNGTVVASNMRLSTAGAGSPLIYSTGAITVTNSTGTATGAQIAVVEGKNSVDLQGCEFSTNGIGNRGSVDNAGVMIYQSMSGDASVGTGSFTATDSTLTVLDSSSVYAEVPFFFVTNTDATIDLTGTTISFSPGAKFVKAVGTEEWGQAGNNGGKVTVSMSETTATSTEVEVDEISGVTGISGV